MQIIKLRAHENPQHKYYIHNNQLEAAKQVIEVFSHGTHWCLLLAEMQAGKTGTFSSVPYLINNNPEILEKLKIDTYEGVLNTYVITGMNFTDLFGQISDDFEGYNGEKFGKFQKLKNHDLNEITKMANKSVLSGTETEILGRMRNNSLFIIDESHYGAGQLNVLNKFLLAVFGITMNGTFEANLKDINCYFLSVSATPLAECITMENEEAYTRLNKKKVILKNDNGYYGIVDMFKNNKIRPSFALDTQNESDDLLNIITSYNEPGYHIVRDSKDIERNIENAKYKNKKYKDIKIIRFNGKENALTRIKHINEITELKPKYHTIIFVKDMLRAGIVLKGKENIRLVFDTKSSTPDTTAQSLLGRCCGYIHNSDTDIYCDVESASQYKDWVLSGFDIKYVPRAGAYIQSEGKTRLVTRDYELVENMTSQSLTVRMLSKKLLLTFSDKKYTEKRNRFTNEHRAELLKTICETNPTLNGVKFFNTTIFNGNRQWTRHRFQNVAKNGWKKMGLLGDQEKQIQSSDVGKQWMIIYVNYDLKGNFIDVKYQNQTIRKTIKLKPKPKTLPIIKISSANHPDNS